MKKVPLLSLFMLLSVLLHGAIFPGYDFTFFETVSSDSLMSLDGDNLGLDYTGYGFFGGEARTGIYLRLGVQAPYSSLLSIFSIDDAASDERMQENLEKSFKFSVSAGPSFRKFIGEEAIWYMGLGAAYSLDYQDRESSLTDTKHTFLDMNFGFDFDMGIRIDVEKRTTVRIGVHGAFTFFSINAEVLSPRNGLGESSTTAVMIPNMFLPPGVKQPFQAEGYISLGHTFRQLRKTKEMKYIITSPKRFSGVFVEMDQELPPS